VPILHSLGRVLQQRLFLHQGLGIECGPSVPLGKVIFANGLRSSLPSRGQADAAARSAEHLLSAVSATAIVPGRDRNRQRLATGFYGPSPQSQMGRRHHVYCDRRGLALSRRAGGSLFSPHCWLGHGQMATGLTVQALEMALQHCRVVPGLLHHSDRGSQGGFKWSLQHLDGGGCDEHSKAAFGSVWAAALAVTRSTAGGRTR
jgi:hypothetical protein